MLQTRLSILLNSYPDWLKILISAIVYTFFFVVGIVCFYIFTDIFYAIGLVLLGSNPPSPKGFEVAFGILPPLAIGFLLSVISVIWLIINPENKQSILICLGLTIPFSLVFAKVCNVKVNALYLISYELIIEYLIFVLTYFILRLLVPFLLKRIVIKTQELADPVDFVNESKEDNS